MTEHTPPTPTDPNAAALAGANADLAATSSQSWTDRYSHSVMDTFGTPQRVLVRGEGVYVWDADGKRYLDLLAGIAVNALGHAHPTLTAAISAQLGTLGHVSNFFGSPTQIALAETLLNLAGAPEGSRVFFANSGTEANEALFKMARRTGRRRILALEGAFHGRTMGALALTHKAAYREPFEPLPAGVEWLPFGDLEALEQAFATNGEDVAALFIEPLQGEAGVRPLPAGYLTRARELTREHGALLALDEVQTGVGRTGAWFAHQVPTIGEGVVPDVMSLAKGLGGGIPIGAVVAFGTHAATLLGRGQHGTTFGGNPVAAAAALTTLNVIDRDGVLDNVNAVGEQLRTDIAELHHPLIAGVRGRGLLIAIQLTGEHSSKIAARALDAGFIVNAVNPQAIRLAPPLIITSAQLEPFVEFLSSLPRTADEL
ncbi:acetylornithine transaminase [Timonella senegalensis]|uniref:acetylornithine transaminase n=1 Tax=Timonella senegalensis TaxID=1465825 RepID=UPI0028AC0BF5|nr:acetylornithine transaminase [Timonella senegalensis]